MAQFTILTVCTGNVCRSPLAAALLRKTLRDVRVTVHSAGTHALEDRPMPEQQIQIARALGIENPETHFAKQLTHEHVIGADLILGMDHEHRSAVVELRPQTLRKTFTLRELARISQSVVDTELGLTATRGPKTKLRAAIEVAAFNRGVAPPADSPEDDEVIDPYRRSQETYLASRDQIVPAVNQVAAYLKKAVA